MSKEYSRNIEDILGEIYHYVEQYADSCVYAERDHKTLPKQEPNPRMMARFLWDEIHKLADLADKENNEDLEI